MGYLFNTASVFAHLEYELWEKKIKEKVRLYINNIIGIHGSVNNHGISTFTGGSFGVQFMIPMRPMRPIYLKQFAIYANNINGFCQGSNETEEVLLASIFGIGASMHFQGKINYGFFIDLNFMTLFDNINQSELSAIQPSFAFGINIKL